MGRRNDHNQDEFNHLVFTSIENFLTRSPASELSLRKVAKMIGYAPSTLIHTYSNWSMLLLKVNARTLDRLLERLDTLEQEINDSEQRLYAIAESYLAFACQQPYQWSLVFEHKLPTGYDIPEWMQSRIHRLFSLVESCLVSINPGRSPTQIQLSANSLWASVHGITLLAVDDKLSLHMSNDPKAMVHDVLNHYLQSWKKG